MKKCKETEDGHSHVSGKNEGQPGLLALKETTLLLSCGPMEGCPLLFLQLVNEEFPSHIQDQAKLPIMFLGQLKL